MALQARHPSVGPCRVGDLHESSSYQVDDESCGAGLCNGVFVGGAGTLQGGQTRGLCLWILQMRVDVIDEDVGDDKLVKAAMQRRNASTTYCARVGVLTSIDMHGRQGWKWIWLWWVVDLGGR